MKKLLLCITAGLIAFEANTQTNKTATEKRSLLSFSAGISLPIICYAKTDISKNSFAGFARPGFTIDVSYGYRFNNHIGIMSSAFFSSNKTDTKVLTATGNDNYHYFGVLAGPLLTTGFSSKVNADFTFRAGFARVWSPKMVLRGETLMNKDASFAFTWSAGADLRYDISEKTFLLLKADHMNLKPKFNSHSPEESLKNEQHIAVMNFDAGIGIKF